jgi:NADH-quinone oxidoreductase subunit N
MPQLGSYMLLAPVIAISIWALVVLVAELFSVGRRHLAVAWLTVVALIATALITGGIDERGVFGGAIALDGLTVYATVLACALAALSVVMAMDYLPTTGIEGGEYYPLVLFAVAGVVVMAAATDLIVMFLGLETMSIAVYVLAGIWKSEEKSNEAALKYFLLGAFASAFMLYGIALVYAATGSTLLSEIATYAADVPASEGRSVLLVGAAMLMVGFGFKVAAVPFHLWTPDVYEGAPTSVTVFMATVVKLGAFAATIRTMLVGFEAVSGDLWLALWIAAAVTMTVGNFVALRQTGIKRMLAYSSIAHSGYLLVGLAAGTPEAGEAMLFYLAVYGVMNLGAFGVAMALSEDDATEQRLSDLAGIGHSRPVLAIAMTLCMLSLVGIPPLGGFLGKLYLFSAALEAGLVGLVIVAVLNSAVSAFYYLGVVRIMYFDRGNEDPQPLASRPYIWAALAISVAAVVAFGLMPGSVLSGATVALEGVLLGP